MTTVLETIHAGAAQLTAAHVAFGHGTTNADDEAAWLVLWQLGLPLDTPLDGPDSMANMPVAPGQQAQIATLFEKRITTRKPAAYLTQEAWLQGVPFYVDERAIVPRSFIAELLADGSIDYWLGEHTQRVLDLCTGNGSLAVLAAMVYPAVVVDKHDLATRITLHTSDGLAALTGPYDLILCNPPYVNSSSMAALPAEYQAEPVLALAGGADGMDFIRQLLRDAPARMAEHAVMVLEIGNERAYFDAAFPTLEAIWLETSAGDDQVLLLTRAAIDAM